MDFNEIMNLCGYDLKKADAMAKQYAPWMEAAVEEAMTYVGLEEISK